MSKLTRKWYICNEQVTDQSFLQVAGGRLGKPEGFKPRTLITDAGDSLRQLPLPSSPASKPRFRRYFSRRANLVPPSLGIVAKVVSAAEALPLNVCELCSSRLLLVCPRGIPRSRLMIHARVSFFIKQTSRGAAAVQCTRSSMASSGHTLLLVSFRICLACRRHQWSRSRWFFVVELLTGLVLQAFTYFLIYLIPEEVTPF